MADVDRIRIYHHCPRCGSTSTEVRTSQLVVCHTCDLRLYYNPCAATAAILLDAHDRVLTVRRAKEPAKGMLAFPGGFVDDGESAEEGVRREVSEETGLKIGALEFLLSRPNTYPYRGIVYRTLDFFFVARVDDFGEARPLDGVAEIVTTPIDGLRLEDLAFVSMKAAWSAFLERRR
jgi:ADP-ribose pyrophosphatase YjhB (NUDIX family)